MTRVLRVAGLVLVAALLGARRLPARPQCPAGTEELVLEGWRLYRADSMAAAAARFDAALLRCRESTDAMTGRAYVHLRQGTLSAADSLFAAVTARVPRAADAWEGRALVAERQGRTEAAFESWRQLLELVPSHPDARARMDRLAPGWERRAVPLVKRRASALDLTLRVRGEGFELRRGTAWAPFYMKGVNLGLAMPGRYPSEFPTDSALYDRWLGQIAGMHANTLRIYTILPPEFYRALRGFNLSHPQTPLYVVHGVWTELPPRDDFNDAGFNRGFEQEIRHVVDLLHGAAEFAPSPGHAGGRYDADVSPWTIAYILGREWEPYSVVGFNEDSTAARAHLGQHLVLEAGTPTDAWMVRQCDYLLTYEEETYNAQRPIAYTNWPTTDPIRHPTETTYEQQMRFRGIDWTPDPSRGPIHEEEGVALDPSLVRTTPRNVAGWFASYHVYPYYPDFLLVDPGYSQARSSLGPSNYFGYLRDLRRVHRGIPLVISEFGVPTSRGVAHLQPQGWNHGGLSEDEAAAVMVRLAREIEEAGAAGAIAFAWIDEWFKKNWFVSDFELPVDHERRWHNMLDPEEHYGIVALRPGRAGEVPLPGGAIGPWRALPTWQRGTLLGGRDTVTLRIGEDAGFLYLALDAAAWRGRPFPWAGTRLQIGLDTHDAERGQHRLPTSDVRSGAGFEFLVDLASPTDAQLRVTPEYLLYRPLREVQSGAHYGEPFRRPLRSVRRDDAVFDTLWALTNRPRFLDYGKEVKALGTTIGRLRFGTVAQSSIVDWWYDEANGMVQLRLPWGLLNVADPSTGRILSESDPDGTAGPRPGPPPSELTGIPSEGLRIGVVAVRPGRGVLGAIPTLDAQGTWPLATFRLWTWTTWEEPTWHEYLKPSYRALQQLWGAP